MADEKRRFRIGNLFRRTTPKPADNTIPVFKKRIHRIYLHLP